MAKLYILRATAFLLQVSLLSGVSEARSEDRPASFLARGAAPGPAAAAPTLTVAAAAPAAAAAATAGTVDCTGTCEEAKKMWKEAKEAQDLAIALQANQTADRINAETDLLVEEVKLKVRTSGLNSLKLMAGQVDSYMNGRVQAFSGAVGSRHQQVVAAKAKQFETLKEHQKKLMGAMTSDIVNHGYEVAKNVVANEAARAGASFNSNPKIQGALKQVNLAGDAWVKTYHASEEAAGTGFNAWSTAYNSLMGPWSNVTGTFTRANAAAKAARGLGPDTRWANEMTRVSGEVAQAGNGEIRNGAAHADLALNMARKAEKVVKGNSGSIVRLKAMLTRAENMANQAAMAR